MEKLPDDVFDDGSFEFQICENGLNDKFSCSIAKELDTRQMQSSLQLFSCTFLGRICNYHKQLHGP